MNNFELFTKFIPDKVISEEHIKAALHSRNFVIFEILMKKKFNNNRTEIFKYIEKEKIIMKIAKKGNEDFLINLFKNFIFPLGVSYINPKTINLT